MKHQALIATVVTVIVGVVYTVTIGQGEPPPASQPAAQQRIEDLRSRIVQLMSSGEYEEAARLETELAALQRRESPDAAPRSRRSVEPVAVEMRREIERLRSDGRAEEGARLEHELARMRGADAPGSDNAADRGFAARIGELTRSIGRLRQAGRNDEARQLEEEVDRLTRMLFGESPRTEPEASGEIEEIERRVHHLSIVIENLHAAGMQEAAEGFTRQIEELERELSLRQTGPKAPEDLERHIQELSQAMRELRTEVDELKETVRQLQRQVERLSAESRAR